MRRGVDHSVTFCRPRESLFVRRCRGGSRIVETPSCQNIVFELADDSGMRCTTSQCSTILQLDALPRYSARRVDVHRRRSPATLCQNCVRYPPKPPVNTVIYGDTSTPIDVAEVVDRRVCRKELVCVRTRGGSQFPSVLLHPPPLALRSSRALARCLAVAA